MPARHAAFEILQSVRNGRPFDRARDLAVASLDERDRRLAHEIAAGVLRQQAALDRELAPLAAHGWAGVAAPVKDVLRIAAYQVRYLSRIPPHAAVDAAVTMAGQVGDRKVAGFVNAVLRRLTAAGSPRDRAEREDEDLWRSHPDWLVGRWRARFGAEDARRLLAWNNTRPALVIQPARAALDSLASTLADAGIPAEFAPCDAGLTVAAGRPERLPGFAEGAFVVQDPAHALVVRYAGLDGVVYDACASPGGKTIALGRRAGLVLAGDRSRGKVQRLAANLRRAGSGREHALVADALHPPFRAVDAVLLDAPCTGTGTLARHPDARWKLSARRLASLVAAQQALLESAAVLVRPGGALVYATCSIEPEENEDQVDSFLERHPDYRREPAAGFPAGLLNPLGDLMILPHRDRMDGAYAARLRREA